MRYIGAATDLFGSQLDPALKAQLLIAAQGMPDAQAEDLADLSDATPYGSKQRWIRMGIGAGVGLVAGLVVGRALKKR